METSPVPGAATGAGAAAADLERLWELQLVDGAIRAAREALESHPERREAEAARHEAEALSARRREEQERLRQLKLAVRRAESELAAAEQEARQLHDRLFAGTVSNPKELSSLETRYEATRQRASRLQDEALERMVELEAAEKGLQELEARLAEAGRRLQEAEARWARTRSELEAELARLEKQRAELAGAVENPTFLARYERLAAAKGGQALALVDADRCSGCGVPLSTYVMTEARRKQRMTFCEVCGRILFWRRPIERTGAGG